MKKEKIQRFTFYILISCTFSLFLYYYFSPSSNKSYSNSSKKSLSHEKIDLSSTNFENKFDKNDKFQKNARNDKKGDKNTNNQINNQNIIPCPSCNFTPIFPPTSTRRDVVLAAALNKLKRVEVFLRTLRMTGSRCRIILFLDNKKTIEPHFLRFFKACDIEPVYVNNNNNSVLIGGAKMTRYYYYQQWLSKHIDEVDRVLHSDTFDVLFQSDPFLDDMLPVTKNREESKHKSILLSSSNSNSSTKEKTEKTTYEKITNDKATNEKIDKTTNEKTDKTTYEKITNDKATNKKIDKTTDEKTTNEKTDKTTNEKTDKITNEKIDKTTNEKTDKITNDKATDEKIEKTTDKKTTNEKITNDKKTNEKIDKKTDEKIEKITNDKTTDEKTTNEKITNEKATDEKIEKATNEKSENVLYFTFEPVSLEDSRWTASWVSECYGPNILHKYRKFPVSCSGVTIGYAKAFLKYLDVMLSTISWRKCFGDSLDQAHHNYVLYHGDLKNAGIEIKSLDCNSRFLTMHFCCKKGKCHLDEQTNIMYGNATNKAPVLVHQYNRWKNLTKRNKIFCPGSAKNLFNKEKSDLFDMAEIERLPPLKVILPDKLM